MSEDEPTAPLHELPVTVWVGKRGVGAVTEEVAEQLSDRGAVKVKFLRSARGGTDTAALVEELAKAVDGEVVDIRGHTGVIRR